MNKKRLIGAGILITLLLAGYGGFKYYKTQTAAMMAAMSAIPPAVVETGPVTSSTMEKKIQATGSLKAINGIQVRPEIPGRITKIYFTSGSDISQGDNLIQLDDSLAKATLEQAQAKLKLAQQTYGRMAKLIKPHIIAQSDLDKARAELDSSTAAAKEAQAAFDKTLIKAPFAGRLGLSQVSVGDYVSPGQNLVNLQTLTPIDVEFTVPETDVGELALQQKVIVHSSSYQDQEFAGEIYAIDSLENPQTRTVAVRAQIPNSDKKLLPGSFAQVTVILASDAEVLTIPQTAVSYEGDKIYVYKVVDNKAVTTPIKLGPQLDKNRIVVEKGLKENDIVVTAGQIKLFDGAAIAPNSSNDKK